MEIINATPTLFPATDALRNEQAAKWLAILESNFKKQQLNNSLTETELSSLKAWYQYLLQQRLPGLATQDLVCATGEQNQLMYRSRGLILLDHLPTDVYLHYLLLAWLTGNQILLPQNLSDLIQDLIKPLQELDSEHRLIMTRQPVASLLLQPELSVYLGTMDQAELNQLLQQRQGPLLRTLHWSEDKWQAELAQPDQLLYWVSEYTLCQNLSAIGGNASLLNQG